MITINRSTMVHFTSALTLTLSALALHAQGAPIQKRIAQTIADSTALWEKACVSGPLPYNTMTPQQFGVFRTVRTDVDIPLDFDSSRLVVPNNATQSR